MAIKGKSKTKSRPKPAARPPRHEPVVVKPPLFARRWIQVTAAMLLGAFVVMVVVWATNGLRRDSRQKAAAATAQSTGATKRTAGLEWQGVVEGAARQIGTLNPPLPPVMFKAMNAIIDTMKKKGTIPKGAGKTLTDAITSAKKALGTLTNFDLTTNIRDKGFDVAGALYFTESKDRLVAAITSYQRSAEAALAAANAPAAQTKTLTTIADELRSDANTQFQTGWGIYQSALGSAGISTTPSSGGLGSGLGGG